MFLSRTLGRCQRPTELSTVARVPSQRIRRVLGKRGLPQLCNVVAAPCERTLQYNRVMKDAMGE